MCPIAIIIKKKGGKWKKDEKKRWEIQKTGGFLVRCLFDYIFISFFLFDFVAR
jgi:hypothetical protein